MPRTGDIKSDNSHTPCDPAVDPRYLAMASRIASYYQQRCQAVANFQQQRCQVWANAQRQKCQEVMQAAMLVVAWYIRDRISRRRKRQRRSFMKGLKQKASLSSAGRITKGEAVRRWVLDVPLRTETRLQGSGSDVATPLDEAEAAFQMDQEDQTPDKDSQLFSVADNLIRSQLTRIDVPLLGTLSFDESDDESECDEDSDNGDEENYEQADDEEIAEWEYDDGEEEEDDDSYREDEREPEEIDAAGSKSVHLPSTASRRCPGSSRIS